MPVCPTVSLDQSAVGLEVAPTVVGVEIALMAVGVKVALMAVEVKVAEMADRESQHIDPGSQYDLICVATLRSHPCLCRFRTYTSDH